MKRKTLTRRKLSIAPSTISIITFILTIFIWNQHIILNHIPAFITPKPIIASVCSSIPLFGPPTSAHIFVLAGKTTIEGYHFEQSLNIRVIEREKVDWNDCEFVVRWLMPKDVIVDVSQLDRDSGYNNKAGVKSYTRWTTSRMVDLELPVYSLDSDDPFLLEARMTFEHSQWQSSRFEVKYDFTLKLLNALIRYQLPNGIATFERVSIPQPALDFTCNTRIPVVDIFGKGAYGMAKEAKIPVAGIVEVVSIKITPVIAMTITVGASMLGALAISLV